MTLREGLCFLFSGQVALREYLLVSPESASTFGADALEESRGLPSTRGNRHRNFTARAHASRPRFFLSAGIYVGRNGTPSRRPRETLLNAARAVHTCARVPLPSPPPPFRSIWSARTRDLTPPSPSCNLRPVFLRYRARSLAAREIQLRVYLHIGVYAGPRFIRLSPPPPSPSLRRRQGSRADYAGAAAARNRRGARSISLRFRSPAVKRPCVICVPRRTRSARARAR